MLNIYIMLAAFFGLWLGFLTGYRFGHKAGTEDTLLILQSRVETRLDKASAALEQALAKEGE